MKKWNVEIFCLWEILADTKDDAVEEAQQRIRRLPASVFTVDRAHAQCMKCDADVPNTDLLSDVVLCGDCKESNQ